MSSDPYYALGYLSGVLRQVMQANSLDHARISAADGLGELLTMDLPDIPESDRLIIRQLLDEFNASMVDSTEVIDGLSAAVAVAGGEAERATQTIDERTGQ